MIQSLEPVTVWLGEYGVVTLTEKLISVYALPLTLDHFTC